MYSYYYRKNTTNIANNCNQFIVAHLTRIKAAAYKSKNQRKFAVYNTAIQSIKKYPLPLICSTQLRMLSGIGDFLCDQLTKVIKIHYKSFLNSRQNLSQKFNSIQKQPSQYQQLNDDDERKDEILEMNMEEADEKSVKSAIVSKIYKPRPNSQAAALLIAMAKMSPKNIYFSRKEIKQFIKAQTGQQSIKGWSNVQVNLQLNGYIAQSSEKLTDIILTQKGREYIEQLNQKSIISSSKSKVVSQVRCFKLKMQQVNSLQGIKQQSQNENEVKRAILKYEDQNILNLIIDCRQMKNQSDRNYFQEKLKQKYNINCKVGSLSVGDFAWIVNDNVLDYIVERKKADDLAASIIDGRYKQQKYRLKLSGVKNIYYLFQGHPSTGCIKNEKQLQNALLKTRVKQGFKVVKTKTINESLKFLAFVHSQLMKKISGRQPLEVVGDLHSFNKQNSKKGGLTIQLFFGLGVKCFPGVGKGNVGNLMKYFKTFRTLHDKLKQFLTQEQKIEFIRQLLKKGRAPSNFPKLLVNFLFSEQYK